MIKIYDYLAFRQPEIAVLIKRLFQIRKPRALKAEKVRIRLWVNEEPVEWWREIMQEPPLPGRAGLLPGEDWKVVGL